MEFTPVSFLYNIKRDRYNQHHKKEPSEHEKMTMYAEAEWEYKHASLHDKLILERQVKEFNQNLKKDGNKKPKDIGGFGRIYRREDPSHISRFKKHLSTNKEWFVVTDKNRNVLSAREGQKDHVNPRTMDKAFSEARSKLPEGDQEVYAFHSHPRHYGIAAESPSKEDLDGIRSERKYKNLNVIAEGVMTRHGVNVIGIDPTRRAYNIPKYYDKQVTKQVVSEGGRRGISYDTFKTKDPQEQRVIIRMINAGLNKAFSDTQERYPEMRTEFIKRDIIRPSDVRPHTVINRSMHQYQYRKPEINEELINEIKKLDFGQPSPESIGEFGKRKKKKCKAKRMFYGI